MAVENGEWVMHGLDWDNPCRIRSYQELINWVVAEIYEPFLYEESIKANDEALQTMKDAGLEVIDFTAEDLAKMRQAAQPAYDLIRQTVGDEPMELIAQAQAAAAGCAGIQEVHVWKQSRTPAMHGT